MKRGFIEINISDISDVHAYNLIRIRNKNICVLYREYTRIDEIDE